MPMLGVHKKLQPIADAPAEHGVICQRNNMSKRKFWAVVLIVCFITHILCYFHFVYTGDTVAAIFGYFASLVVMPFAFIGVLAIALISFLNFSTKQKWALFLAPTITLASFLVYFYYVIQYGGPH
jgi:uncharacterized membrane protein YuzA (DUF378 family)